MIQTITAKEITLKQLKELFGLQLISDSQFFPEWQENLPEITDGQTQLLDQIKSGFLNLRETSSMLESLIRIAILGPLLFIGHFYEYPCYVKAEHSVEIISEDEGTIIKGNIDFLLLKNQLWIVAIESKKAGYSIEVGLDQLLAYMLASPHPDRPVYGMITNGSEYIFVKLMRDETPKYGLSDVFNIRDRGNKLYNVLQILLKLSQLVE